MSQSIRYSLRNLISLRHLSPGLSHRLFLIFGCQRSGTTLLLAILKAHPSITGTDETEFPSPYPFPSAQRLAFNQLTGQYSCFKMLEHSNKLDFLAQFYPKAKILWPVRNPHSTLSSMLNLTNVEGSWIDRCRDSELKRLRPFFPDQLSQECLSELSSIEKAALYWTYKNQYPAILENQGFEVFPFKYENLLEHPRETLEHIVNFLGVGWSEDLLNFYQKNPGKVLAGGTRTDQPINVERANNLKNSFSAMEISHINRICAPVMNVYGYPMLNNGS